MQVHFSTVTSVEKWWIYMHSTKNFFMWIWRDRGGATSFFCCQPPLSLYFTPHFPWSKSHQLDSKVHGDKSHAGSFFSAPFHMHNFFVHKFPEIMTKVRMAVFQNKMFIFFWIIVNLKTNKIYCQPCIGRIVTSLQHIFGISGAESVHSFSCGFIRKF